MEPLLATFTAYISQYFMLALVWIVAAILSLSRWRRHPRASRFTLIAVLILFAESLVNIFVGLYLPLILRDADRAIGNSTVYFGFLSLLSSVMQAVAWSFIIAAIFSQRDKM